MNHLHLAHSQSALLVLERLEENDLIPASINEFDQCLEVYFKDLLDAYAAFYEISFAEISSISSIAPVMRFQPLQSAAFFVVHFSAKSAKRV